MLNKGTSGAPYAAAQIALLELHTPSRLALSRVVYNYLKFVQAVGLSSSFASAADSDTCYLT